jgi:hypothetical protein
MRSWEYTLLAIVLVALGFYWFRSPGGGQPRAGDTVIPVLAGPVDWTAGQGGEIRVRLEARNKDGSSTRPLGFEGVPSKADPVLRIVFFQGSLAQSPIEIKLSHRC